MFLPLIAALSFSQAKPNPTSEAILKRLSALRALPESRRATEFADLARTIDKSTTGDERVTLASMVVSQSTEGDLGRPALKVVADVLAHAVKASPAPPERGEPAYAYTLLAQLERYEGIPIDLQDPEFKRAEKAIDEANEVRSKADFQLKDLEGKTWKLSSLKGKIVLLNFWATWCPPCRKEMPDIEKLFEEYRSKGLLVLAVSDEEPEKVKAFAEKAAWTFPVLLDPGRTVEKLYRLESIPKTFIYSRDGKLAATAIDMRTRDQLLRMLSTAGLRE